MRLDDLAKQLEANEIDRYLKSNLAKFNYQPENVLSSPNKQKLSLVNKVILTQAGAGGGRDLKSGEGI